MDRSALSRQEKRSSGTVRFVKQGSSDICDMDVATDRWASVTEIREADRSRASGPPMPGESHATSAATGCGGWSAAEPWMAERSGANGPAIGKRNKWAVDPGPRPDRRAE